MEASENSILRHPRKGTSVVGFGYVRMQLSRSQQGFLTSPCAGQHVRWCSTCNFFFKLTLIFIKVIHVHALKAK